MFLTNVSISQVQAAKENAATVTKQFPLRPTKVKQIIKSIKAHNQFLSTFTFAVLGDDWYLVGGRHRLQALQTILSEDGLVLEAGSEDEVFPAVVHEVESLADVVLLTQFDNDSRSMPPAEKQYLGYSFEVNLDGEDYAVNNVARLRTAYLHLGISHPTLNSNTVRQIWGATIGSLTKEQKKVLTTNEDALRSFGKRFEELLVVAAKETATPARNYKKVAESIVLKGVADSITGFDVVSKAKLSKRDKEDVAILGAALERSLESEDKVYDARKAARLAKINAAIDKEQGIENNSEVLF
jgi:hypothetical protein